MSVPECFALMGVDGDKLLWGWVRMVTNLSSLAAVYCQFDTMLVFGNASEL